MGSTGIEEELVGVLVTCFHGEVTGGEVGRRESVPGGASREKDAEDGCMALLCSVHQRTEALGVEVGHVGAGVYQRLHLFGVTAPGGLAQLIRLVHGCAVLC